MHDSKDDATAGERAGLDASSGKENAGAGEAGGLLNTEWTPRQPGDYRAKYAIVQHMQEEIDRRFKYHPPKDDQAERYEGLRGAAHRLATMIVHLVPPGREQSLALTKLEEAIMHANSAIARGE